MKYIKFSLVILLTIVMLGCVISLPNYSPNIPKPKSLNYWLDSIRSADRIYIPDTSSWNKTYYVTNKGPMEMRSIIIKSNNKTSFINVLVGDNDEIYNYRRE